MHLGPPKTGSTSLQHLFAQLSDAENPLIAYIGIRHERGSFLQVIDPASNRILERSYLLDSRQVTEPTWREDELRTALIELSQTGQTIVLSDEMYLIDQPTGVRWQTKVKSLWTRFDRLQVTPLIIMRNPKDAVRSLYLQSISNNQQQFRWVYRVFPFSFWFSNNVRAYDYEYVLRILKESGASRVRVLLLEDIADRRLISKLFGKTLDVELSWKKENVSQKTLRNFWDFPLSGWNPRRKKLMSSYSALSLFLKRSEERSLPISDFLSSLE